MQRQGTPPEPRPMMELLTVTIGGVRCGFVAADVVAVHHAARPQPLPGAPPMVEGVFNIGGTPVPLLDLRKRLGLAPQPLRAWEHLIVLKGGRASLAVRVDRAENLITAPADAIHTVPETAEAVAGGAVCLADGLLLIYDPDRFLTEPESEALEQAVRNLSVSGER